MSNAEPPESALQERDREVRVVFFGRRCRLSAVPLTSMIEGGVAPVAVVVPARFPGQHPIRRLAPLPAHATLPMAGAGMSASSIAEIAHEAGMPLYEVGSLRDSAVAETIRSLQPDLIVLSCFPWHVPAWLLELARLGGLNLHPSLLPHLRGPDPLFWAYRLSLPETGVTVHRLVHELDAGPIVGQATLPLPPGLPGDELERRAATVGGALLAESVWRITCGDSMTLAQDEDGASYQSWPGADDLRLEPAWSAERVRSFVHGVVPLGYDPWVTVGGRDLIVAAALDPGTTDGQHDSDVVSVSFADDAVRLLLRRTSPNRNRRA